METINHKNIEYKVIRSDEKTTIGSCSKCVLYEECKDTLINTDTNSIPCTFKNGTTIDSNQYLIHKDFMNAFNGFKTGDENV